MDYLIQQTLLQQFMPIFDSLLSDYNYGFCPGRSAHQAIGTARVHVVAGHHWCVDSRHAPASLLFQLHIAIPTGLTRFRSGTSTWN